MQRKHAKVYKCIALLLAAILFLGEVLVGLPIKVSASTNNGNILMGVPTVDGVVDDIYKQSLTLTTGVGENAYGTPWGEDNGYVYFLYSENYLYICAEIYDNSVVSAGEAYVSKSNPYQNDCCEFRLSLNGSKTESFKVGVDAYGLRAYGTDANHGLFDYSTIVYATSYDDGTENSGYIVEVAIPYNDGVLNLTSGEQLGFKLQLNDLDYDGTIKQFATDYAGEGAKGLVFYDLSNEVVSGSVAGGDENLGGGSVDVPEDPEYNILSFAADGNYKHWDTVGSGSVNKTDGTIDVTCLGTTNPETAYRFQTQFLTSDDYSQEYKYIRVLYAADNPEGVDSVEMKLANSGAPHGTLILSSNVTDTNGEYVLSPATELTDEFTSRFDSAQPVQLRFLTTETGGLYKVKAFYFFNDLNAANAFTTQQIDFQKLSFAADGNYKHWDAVGSGSVNKTDGTIDVTCLGTTNPETAYRFQTQFLTSDDYSQEYKYIRVLYAADNPEGVDSVEMKLANSGAPHGTLILSSVVSDTNGEYVLTPTTELTDEFTARFDSPQPVQLRFLTTATGGLYKVKAFYFFNDLESANAFTPSMDAPVKKTIKINGVDISEYRIVIPTEGFGKEYSSAFVLQTTIKDSYGAELEIVTDAEAPIPNEILIGDTNRTESHAYYVEGGRYHPSAPKFSTSEYRIDRIGNKVVVVSAMYIGIEKAVELFTYKLSTAAQPADITEECIGSGYVICSATYWSDVTNVANPESFEDNFDKDEGYWSKDSDKASWTIVAEGTNNVFSTADNASALSYLHVFEKNVSYEAKLKYTEQDDGTVALLLRHTADDAYVKVGYDFAAGEWFIDSREGKDFLLYRLAAEESPMVANRWYTIKVVVDAENAELYVDGTKVLETDCLSQLTPGKVGLIANGVTAQADDVYVELLSGQGSIMRNVVHTKLPGEDYREGGSVVELSDGTLVYCTFRNDACFESKDQGLTWSEREEPWVDLIISPQFLRLQNGELIWLTLGYDENNVWSHEVKKSTDEGETWTTISYVCKREFENSGVNGSNMNDKVTQMSDGRIFYCISYDAQSKPVNGRKVFCEFYYSDDNGLTWTRSETGASFDIPGNEDQVFFGECKILETSTPGTLRMYNSWNSYGCIVYSESTDNGVTWGPIQKMEDYPCTRSSMQFVRDPYEENATTYYMVWVENDSEENGPGDHNIPRSHLSLAKTIDGVNWESLGDVWRWESRTKDLVQVVDPFIQVTEDYILVGSGIAEEYDAEQFHNAQRQHIYSIAKSQFGEAGDSGDDTEDNVEVEATIYAEGATVVAPENGWVVGSNTFTVQSENACVVAVSNDGGESYTRLTGTASTDGISHIFTAENVTSETKIVVLFKGDVNLDGMISVEDRMALTRGLLDENNDSYVAISGLHNLAADIDGNGVISVADRMALNRALLESGDTSYVAPEWDE